MIFQRPNPFPLSIRKNLEYPLREHGLRDAGERYRRIEDVLKGVGLWDEVKTRLDSPALNLSGGQQQRLCVARALLLEPTVLLMDEPCSSLDPLSSAIVEDLIQKLKRRYTVVVVTHNLAQAERLADYVAVFWQENGVGRLVEYGTRKKIFEEPETEITALYVRGASG
jgi:phosphate transport system ATP-binding protein